MRIFKHIYWHIGSLIISLRHGINPYKKLEYTMALYRARLTEKELKWIKTQSYDIYECITCDDESEEEE